MSRLLLAGESWTAITTHQKGFDSFSTVDYTESGVAFKKALGERGWTVTHIPSHRIGLDFPTDLDALAEYDAVVLSDIGSNSFLLPFDVFFDSKARHDPLALLGEYVRGGGALLMVGGYMSFTGIDGKARYGMTSLAPVLPVTLLEFDDRIERPDGVVAEVVESAGNPVAGFGEWPALLGYNRTRPRPEATVWATVGPDPLIATAPFGKGRSGVFTSDLAPHWATPEFVDWEHYGDMWIGLLGALLASQ